jgi:hypothetical protein
VNLVEQLIVPTFHRVILMESRGDSLRIGGIEFRPSGDGIGSGSKGGQISRDQITIYAPVCVGGYQNAVSLQASGGEIHRQTTSMARSCLFSR